MKIIFATANEGKLHEVKQLFSGTEAEILSLKDFKDAPGIVENADTFEGNAWIKAETVFEKYAIPCIADDSGLAVEQLNWQPGVYSARYAGENCTYEDNNLKLLKELQKFPEPHNAKFVCSALYYDGNNKIVAQGELLGRIITEFKGENGFGYDPIFIPDGYDITLAEMTTEMKNKISHRARAFHKLKEELFSKGVL